MLIYIEFFIEVNNAESIEIKENDFKFWRGKLFLLEYFK